MDDDDDVSIDEVEEFAEMEAQGDSAEALKNAILGKKIESEDDDLGVKSGGEELQLIQVSEEWLEAMREELTCGICRNLFKDPIALWCGHVLCRRCARELIQSTRPQRPSCPTCRARLRKHEDEEAVTCIPIQGLVALLRQDDNDEENEQEDEDDCFVAAARSRYPINGWTRVRGFQGGIVYATRNYYRNKHMVSCLAFNSSEQEAALDDIFFASNNGELFLRPAVCQLIAEDDEYEEGLPWIVTDDQGDQALIDHAAPSRNIELYEEKDIFLDRTTLENGIGIFDRHEFRISSEQWTIFYVIDPTANLEMRFAFRFFNDGDDINNDKDDSEEDDDDSEEDDDQYNDKDSFIASEDDDDVQVDLTGDDSPEQPPRTNKRRRLISPVDDDEDEAHIVDVTNENDEEEDDEERESEPIFIHGNEGADFDDDDDVSY